MALPFLILQQKTKSESHKERTSLSERVNLMLVESRTFQLPWYPRGLQRDERYRITVDFFLSFRLQLRQRDTSAYKQNSTSQI